MRKYLPTKEQLRQTKSLRFLGDVIFEPNLWHFNRHSVSFGLMIGVFCCFLPIPFQMVPAVLGCIWIRCNVPIAIAMVWITNPLTMGPIYFGTYKFGAWLMGVQSVATEADLSWESLTGELAGIWQPLLLGSVLAGLLMGSLVFIAARLYWRWKVAKHWSMRRLRKRLAATIHSEAHQQAEHAPHDKQDKASRQG